MRTFDQSLFELYRDGAISLEQALEAASHPHDFKLLVASEGQRSTSVQQIYGDREDDQSKGDSHQHEQPGEHVPSRAPYGGPVSVSPPG
jgi:twitching motility protein PilT